MMIPDPLVSVVMPVFNGERYLRESIESVLNQSWSDFEFIIINDGSTDNTATILSSYDDPRLVILENDGNQGIVKALNKGLHRARGKYVARQDADDTVLPNRLERQVRFLDTHPDITAVGSAYYEIDVAGKRLRRVSLPTNDLEIRWHSLFLSPFVHSAVMFRRQPIIEMGGYSSSPSVMHVEDYDLWRKLLWAGHRMTNLSRALVQWRVNPNGVSATSANLHSQNYSVLVTDAFSNLTGRRGDNTQDLVWLWALEAGCGLPGPHAAKTALELLPSLMDGFARHFQLNSSDRKRLSRIAFRRAAHTLLQNARQYSYASHIDQAAEIAAYAVRADVRVALTPRYFLVRLRLLLGAKGLERFRRARTRIRETW